MACERAFLGSGDERGIGFALSSSLIRLPSDLHSASYGSELINDGKRDVLSYFEWLGYGA
jgi:hypothetical protein